jgi:hypothetical protein
MENLGKMEAKICLSLLNCGKYLGMEGVEKFGENVGTWEDWRRNHLRSIASLQTSYSFRGSGLDAHVGS